MTPLRNFRDLPDDDEPVTPEPEPEPGTDPSTDPNDPNYDPSGGFGDEKGKALADHWIETYKLAPAWDGYTYNDGGKNCSFKKGEFANFIFSTKAGVPLLRLVENDYKTHAIMPTECEMAWTEWFTKFSKDPDTKELYYEGNKVEI